MKLCREYVFTCNCVNNVIIFMLTFHVSMLTWNKISPCCYSAWMVDWHDYYTFRCDSCVKLCHVWCFSLIQPQKYELIMYFCNKVSKDCGKLLLKNVMLKLLLTLNGGLRDLHSTSYIISKHEAIILSKMLLKLITSVYLFKNRNH